MRLESIFLSSETTKIFSYLLGVLKLYTVILIMILILVFFRYESLCPGNPELVAEYKGKIYCFASEDRLNKFMRYMVYHVWNLIL